MLQQVSELRLVEFCDPAHLNCELDAVLEQSLLLHVVRRQNILLLAFAVLVRTFFIRAFAVFQEEFTILGSSIRSSNQPLIE